eukprot:6336819-Prorocentrum_lima.AAC.1
MASRRLFYAPRRRETSECEVLSTDATANRLHGMRCYLFAMAASCFDHRGIKTCMHVAYAISTKRM